MEIVPRSCPAVCPGEQLVHIVPLPGVGKMWRLQLAVPDSTSALERSLSVLVNVYMTWTPAALSTRAALPVVSPDPQEAAGQSQEQTP